jgi:acyl carrier protein
MTDVALQLVKTAVEELASELGYDNLRDVAASTELFGGADGIDSLTLVRLVAEIERSAEAMFRRNVVLADEQAMSRRRSPFRTVGTLAELLRERLGPGDG